MGCHFPPHVHCTSLCMQAYLTSAEFFEVFGSSKQDFYRAPKWRRVQRKKDLGLF